MTGRQLDAVLRVQVIENPRELCFRRPVDIAGGFSSRCT